MRPELHECFTSVYRVEQNQCLQTYEFLLAKPVSEDSFWATLYTQVQHKEELRFSPIRELLQFQSNSWC